MEMFSPYRLNAVKRNEKDRGRKRREEELKEEMEGGGLNPNEK